MKAFVYPGQGAQTVGMGRELYEQYQEARDVFAAADDALGFSITALCFNGPEEELKKTAFTQPAILTVSAACHAVLAKFGVTPDIVGGHSLGEYTALVAAQSLTFADAVRLVHKRGQFMQEAVPLGEGAMAAIIGLDRDTVQAACEKIRAAGGLVEAVNFNCPGQIVIAGRQAAVEQAAAAMKEQGAKRAVMLPVSAPFHSSLMEPAAARLARELAQVEIQNPVIPVVTNVNGKVERDGAAIRETLVRQAKSPVWWEDCMHTIVQAGAQVVVEVGPGKTLTGFTRKIAKDVITLNVEDAASLEKTLDYFREVR